MFETGYDTFKKDILLITKIDLNAYKERQMKKTEVCPPSLKSSSA